MILRAGSSPALGTPVNTSISGHLLFCSEHFSGWTSSPTLWEKMAYLLHTIWCVGWNKDRNDNSSKRYWAMLINRREILGLSYSCAAAFSVWIPKPLKAQQTAGKLSLVELRQKHLTQGFWSSDSLFFKNIGTPWINRLQTIQFIEIQAICPFIESP